MNASSLRVRSFFEQYYVRLVAGLKGRPLAEYRSTLAAWEKATNDPSLDQISNLTMADFKACLMAVSDLKRNRDSEMRLGKLG